MVRRKLEIGKTSLNPSTAHLENHPLSVWIFEVSPLRSSAWSEVKYALQLELALIAIPTYYWSPPHFFRSHRSSTLDFHFLSHYSYIKAIMLYKGNHWTQCAGFMDASWVRLGITNDDLGTSWALPGDNLGMTWGWLGHYFGKTWQDSGILWHTLALGVGDGHR